MRSSLSRGFSGRRRSSGLRVLLVGHGARGRQWADACRSAGVTLAGVVDPDPGAAALAASAGRQTWPSLDLALAEVEADAAVVASPPASHAADTAACVARALPVLLEKPAALGLAEAQALEREVRAAGRPVLIGQNFRFLPRERAVRAALADGSIGEVVRVAVLSARPATAAAPHLAAVENGALWDLALHHLDSLRGRFGEPLSVDASGSTLAPAVRGELRLELEWEGGLLGSYLHVEGAPAYHHHEWVEGDRASLVVDGGRVFLARPGRRWSKLRPPRGPAPERALLDALAVAAAGGGDGELGLSENLGTVALVEATDRSLRLGRPVTLAEVHA
jgi:predicted dehydrogenase